MRRQQPQNCHSRRSNLSDARGAAVLLMRLDSTVRRVDHLIAGKSGEDIKQIMANLASCQHTLG